MSSWGSRLSPTSLPPVPLAPIDAEIDATEGTDMSIGSAYAPEENVEG